MSVIGIVLIAFVNIRLSLICYRRSQLPYFAKSSDTPVAVSS